MNAVIYARYSSDNQREESIEGQLRECKEFAEANDMNSVEEAINRAITGQTPIFFSDRRKLTQEINFRNKNEMQKAEELADSFLKQYTVLKDLIKMQDDDCADYYKQYGC